MDIERFNTGFIVCTLSLSLICDKYVSSIKQSYCNEASFNWKNLYLEFY